MPSSSPRARTVTSGQAMARKPTTTLSTPPTTSQPQPSTRSASAPMIRAAPETIRPMPVTTARTHSVMSGHSAARIPARINTIPATIPSVLR